jgi:hypothetical protein
MAQYKEKQDLLARERKLSECHALLVLKYLPPKMGSRRSINKLEKRFAYHLSKLPIEMQIIKWEQRILHINFPVEMGLYIEKYKKVASLIPRDHPMNGRIEHFLNPKPPLRVLVPFKCKKMCDWYRGARNYDNAWTWTLSIAVLVAQIEHEHETGLKTVLHPAFDIFLNWKMNMDVEMLTSCDRVERQQKLLGIMYRCKQSQDCERSYKISYFGNESDHFSDFPLRGVHEK